MKKLYISLGCGVLMALAACSEQVDMPCIETAITLQASIGDIESNSRVSASPFRGQTPTTDQPLNASVWFSLNVGTYAKDCEQDTGLFPCRTTMDFTDASPQTAMKGTTTLVYPVGDTPQNVYCVGFYPSDDWFSVDGQIATHAIDGEKDLMFASQISGNVTSPFSGQEYQHKLTWLKINVCATNVEAADVWGNIEEITVTSRENLQVTLSDGSIDYTGGIQTIKAFDYTENVNQEKKAMKITMQEVGSILCSPPNETRVITEDNGTETFKNEYVVTIKTEKNNKTYTKELYVSLPITEVNEAIGKLYILTFYFYPSDVVESTCTLATWEAQNEDLYPETPSQSN